MLHFLFLVFCIRLKYAAIKISHNLFIPTKSPVISICKINTEDRTVGTKARRKVGGWYTQQTHHAERQAARNLSCIYIYDARIYTASVVIQETEFKSRSLFVFFFSYASLRRWCVWVQMGRRRWIFLSNSFSREWRGRTYGGWGEEEDCIWTRRGAHGERGRGEELIQVEWYMYWEKGTGTEHRKKTWRRKQIKENREWRVHVDWKERNWWCKRQDETFDNEEN